MFCTSNQIKQYFNQLFQNLSIIINFIHFNCYKLQLYKLSKLHLLQTLQTSALQLTKYYFYIFIFKKSIAHQITIIPHTFLPIKHQPKCKRSATSKNFHQRYFQLQTGINQQQHIYYYLNVIIFHSQSIFLDLKQKHNNCVYFLISQQGILLKSTTQIIRDNVKQQIDKFFTAKIQQLEISQTVEFYQTILKDIQQETERLKDTRDCPYINLVYSEKLKNSCLSMKKFGYSKPYETWQSYQRERKGFCYLIVRPEHRWKQIAANVMAIVKKRQSSQDQNKIQSVYKLEISYQKFIWMYLMKEFQSLKKNLEVKENKNQNTLILYIAKQLTEYAEIQRQLSILKFKYCSKKPKPKTVPKKTLVILSSFEIQKITELIFHEFGLPKLVRQIRRKCSQFIAIGSEIQLLIYEQAANIIEMREDLQKINWKDVEHVFSLGKKYAIVNWQGSNCVTARFDLPLKQNVQKMLKLRMPYLPKYYAYYYKDSYIYLLRKYYPTKFKPFIQQNKSNLFKQIQFISSLIEITKNLHSHKINIGSKFSDSIFISDERIIIEPSQNGSNVEDISKLTLMLRQWVKEMKNQNGQKIQQIRQQLEKISEPYQMLEVLEKYVEEEE